MKITFRRVFYAAFTLALIVTFSLGCLVTLHAEQPHRCYLHNIANATGVCTHSNDPGDWHPPGQPSKNQLEKQKDWMDMVGCGCFWACLFGGAITDGSIVNHKAPGLILKYGLFHSRQA